MANIPPGVRQSMAGFGMNVGRGSRMRQLNRSNGTNSQAKKIVRCQAWKIPSPKLAVRHVHDRMICNRSYLDFEYFCPACNMTFRNFCEYQSHLILKEQQRPYQDEIRETVRFMKEVIETVPHKSISAESLDTPRQDTPRQRNRKTPKTKRRRIRNMNNLVNFTMQLEILQNKIDYDEENLNYTSKTFKFAINSDKKSTNAKKYFNLNDAIENVKHLKRRLVEIKKKREFRELHRVAKTVPSQLAMQSGRGDNWGMSDSYRHSALARQSMQKKLRLADASRRLSELKGSSR